MSADGYTSDTGFRDLPTPQHFIDGRQVAKTIVVKSRKRVLNRKGRAIARIAVQYKSARDVAEIFGIGHETVRRVVENARRYETSRVDDEEEDYAYAPEFAELFPPKNRRRRTRKSPIEVSWSDFHSDLSNDEANDEPVAATKRKSQDTATLDLAPLPKRPRSCQEPATQRTGIEIKSEPNAFQLFHTPNPSSPPASAQASVIPASSTRATILSSTLSVAKPHQPIPLPRRRPKPLLRSSTSNVLPLHVTPQPAPAPEPPASPAAFEALLASVGLTPPRVRAIAGWYAPQRRRLRRILVRTLDDSQTESAAKLSAVDYLRLERLLNRTHAATPIHNTRGQLTITTFLTAIAGFDLSAHQELFIAQGVDIAFLREVAGGVYDSEAEGEGIGMLRTALLDGAEDSLLGDQKGLSRLEFVAPEVGLERIAAGK
ncbi:hypothetical protein MKEN_01172800 [Mycena kentingensis (nom. inval.)]|nr:hypothetical protein MKEN_01172800 [Mycena kentingensis (nom. inval.)]